MPLIDCKMTGYRKQIPIGSQNGPNNIESICSGPSANWLHGPNYLGKSIKLVIRPRATWTDDDGHTHSYRIAVPPLPMSSVEWGSLTSNDLLHEELGHLSLAGSYGAIKPADSNLSFQNVQEAFDGVHKLGSQDDYKTKLGVYDESFPNAVGTTIIGNRVLDYTEYAYQATNSVNLSAAQTWTDNSVVDGQYTTGYSGDTYIENFNNHGYNTWAGASSPCGIDLAIRRSGNARKWTINPSWFGDEGVLYSVNDGSYPGFSENPQGTLEQGADISSETYGNNQFENTWTSINTEDGSYGLDLFHEYVAKSDSQPGVHSVTDLFESITAFNTRGVERETGYGKEGNLIIIIMKWKPSLNLTENVNLRMPWHCVAKEIIE
tara:strand:+ start:389 stop:1519 length:1131 start_codon:yes stop_codon:yes gene_type:complete